MEQVGRLLVGFWWEEGKRNPWLSRYDACVKEGMEGMVGRCVSAL